MLRFVSVPLNRSETALAYTDGGDTIIVLNSSVTDPQRRCDAVNRLLTRLARPAAA